MTVDTAAMRELGWLITNTRGTCGGLPANPPEAAMLRAGADEIDELRRIRQEDLDELESIAKKVVELRAALTAANQQWVAECAKHGQTLSTLDAERAAHEQTKERLKSAEDALEFYAEWGHSLDDKPGLRARNHFARYGGVDE